MNHLTTRAMARLRAADPAMVCGPAAGPATGFADPHSPIARAMLERIMAMPQTSATAKVIAPAVPMKAQPAPPEAGAPGPARAPKRGFTFNKTVARAPRPPLAFGPAGDDAARPRFAFGMAAAQTPLRRFALGAVAAGVVAAVTGLAVMQPWAGDPASAYTVEGRPDGSVAVSFRADQLRDPARLNAELARARARTIVMKMVAAGRCGTAPDLDLRFRLLRDPSPEELAEQLAIWPVKYELRGESVLITILPARIPAGETLVFGYLIRSTGEGRVTTVRPAVVRAVPPCLEAPTPPGR